MYKGLIEINPGYVSWYMMSLSSTSLEILASKQIKINKKLNFFENDRYIFLFEDLINVANEDLQKKSCDEISIIAVGNFPPLVIAMLRERIDLFYITNSIWKEIINKSVLINSLNFWFERDYAKVAWVKKNRLYVQYLPMLKNTDANVSLEVLLKEVSRILCLYDFPKDIKSINVGGLFDSTFDRFISSVILVASKIYPYAKISYDLRAFIEILTNKKLKSYT